MIKRSIGEDYGILQKPVRIDHRYWVVHALSPVRIKKYTLTITND